MMHFIIKENGFKEIRKQLLMRAIPLSIIAAGVGVAISELNPNNKNISDVNIYPFVVPIILGALTVGLLIGLKRQKANYESYVLEFDEKGVTRYQIYAPTIRILFPDIRKITKNKQGGLLITGKNSSNLIIVPAQIEDIESIEAILSENCSIKISTSRPFTQRLTTPLIIAVLGLMAITYISINKIIVSVSGTILTAIMIWSFIKIQTNKNIDKKTKRSSYFVIIVILSIIGVVISKLMS